MSLENVTSMEDGAAGSAMVDVGDTIPTATGRASARPTVIFQLSECSSRIQYLRPPDASATHELRVQGRLYARNGVPNPRGLLRRLIGMTRVDPRPHDGLRNRGGTVMPG